MFVCVSMYVCVCTKACHTGEEFPFFQREPGTEGVERMGGMDGWMGEQGGNLSLT